MKTYLYVDCNNGIRKMKEHEARSRGFLIDQCDDYDDVTYYLKNMGDGHDQTFERVLELPEELLPLVHEEYGIADWSTPE